MQRDLDSKQLLGRALKAALGDAPEATPDRFQDLLDAFAEQEARDSAERIRYRHAAE